ncbi:MAG: type IV toxin-antitoxin system AbiEi family antitoxin domain-containing protein [Streptosporangiales bacterium]|nr:type IV toxin-antitoxin system AbiEi family antitoxin domain-containing protein [Streptosporangiales bacterium]
MDIRLTALAAEQDGVFTRGQAVRRGVDDAELGRLVKRRELIRLRRGAYLPAVLHDEADAVGRHLLLIRAVRLSLRERVVLSHASAAVLHGLTLWRVDLSRVHVTRLDAGAPRDQAGVEHHVGEVDPAQVVGRRGMPTVCAARAVVECAMTAEFESGVVLADSALHHGLVTGEELRTVLDGMRCWPGAIAAGRVVSFADGGSESVGESRARVLFAQQGLPAPVLQREISDRRGERVGRTDFLFEDERTIVEFDGRIKYGREGVAAPGVVVREKVREDRLRELGYEVVRITWEDLAHPERTAARIRAAFARSRVRRHVAAG